MIKNHNRAGEICLLAQFLSALDVQGGKSLELCEKVTNSCSKKAEGFLHDFAGIQISSFNWSSYGKTFTGNRSLRLEVAHFYF